MASLQGKSRKAKQEVHTVYAIIKTGGKQYKAEVGEAIY
ncbi:MAG: 50S ribosomal protein L21, partial [Lacticaseibacillus paracasei]|nr:50S ribosomal protein L21 [Lacticaseibacillus paracasei]